MVRNQYVTVCAWDTAYLNSLARLGREIADQSGCALRVMLFVGMQRQCEENARLLEYVFECAKSMDAEMNVFYTDRPIEKLRKDQSEYLVVRGEQGLISEIRRMLPEKKLVVMEQERGDYDGEDRQTGTDF